MFDILSNEHNMQNQEELNKQQFAYQAMLNRQGANLGYEMWQKTSYPAQVEMMKQAGLNPALMYGQGGGGGGTTATPSGGGASGSQAPHKRGLDIGAILQAKALDSQIKVNESEANKNNADANLTSGAKTEQTIASTKDLLQGVEESQARETLTGVQTEIAELQKQKTSGTIESDINNAKWIALQNKEGLNQMKVKTYQEYKLKETKIAQVNAQLAGTLASNELIRAQKGLTEQQYKSLEMGMKKMQNEIDISWEHLHNEDIQTAVKKFEAEIKAQDPTLGQVAGRISGQLIQFLDDAGSEKEFKDWGSRKVDR